MHNANFSKSYMHGSIFRSLPRAFSPYVNNGCDVVNSSLLDIFRFATVKFKIVLLEFFCI